MADVYTRIGYIKGATGATGAQGEKGDTGEAATIQVGSVTTVPYGQTANVVNSGTEQAAVFDFTIPQGRPGQQTTEMDNLLLNSITTSAAEFPIPAVGETGKVLWGKVTKWFSDMAALVATKFNAANVVNNLTTTASGYALDARQGKALNDSVSAIGVLEQGSLKEVSVATGTFVTIDSMTVSVAGTYVITGDIDFKSSDVGVRVLILDVTETTANTANNSVAVSGRGGLNKTRLVRLNSGDTLYLRGYQTSGGTITCGGRIRALRVSTN